jgi:hypothetical protein
MNSTWKARVACAVAVSLAGCGSGQSSAEDAEAQPIAAESDALIASALKPAQAKTVLRLVDTICGDTWCDGDYDFGFRRISCDKPAHTCTLTLQIFPRAGVSTAQKSYWRSCKTTGFKGFSSLVTSAANGYQALNSDYYDALTECIMRIETKIH